MMIWDVSPVLLDFGPVEIRWYSLLFACGVMGYYFLTRWLWKRRGFADGDFDIVIGLLFVGMVVGARLGEIFFYHPGYYLSEPLEILKIWKGGLASHGATIGLLVAYTSFWLWKRKGGGAGMKSEDDVAKGGADGDPAKMGGGFFDYVDVLVVGMPLVAGFVRLGNFFNSEIVGRAWEWGVVFVQNGEDFARHPVQLYEMLLAWAVFGVLIWFGRRDFGGGRGERRLAKGSYLFLFVGLYFAGRFVLEFFKEYQVLPDSGGWAMGLTMGQVLSVVPVLIAVGWFLWRRKRKGLSEGSDVV
ncbi:prolipoprotein diacylglyceryl transferase [Candidatus Peregrinibacteria bacterium]|nr:prolipoprotein diacylglyceryl transferase [Candidatus Peregrinibacteria bacterium]